MSGAVKQVVRNVFETIGEDVVKGTAREVGRAVVDIGKGIVVEPFSHTDFLKEVYGTREAHPSHEQVKNSNATPLDTDLLKMRAQTKQNDEAQMDAIRQQFFSRVGQEGQQARQELDYEQRVKAQQEIQQQQTQAQQAQQAMQQPQEEPMGKIRKILGGKRPKGGMRIQPQNFERKSNKGK